MKFKKVSPLVLVVSLVAFIFSVSRFVYAEDIPSRDSAGAEQTRFEKEEKEEKKIRLSKGEVPEKKVEVERKDETARPITPEMRQVTFELKSIRITGNQNIPAQELEPFAAEYTGKKISLAELQEIAARIKNYYRDKGYIAAYVYVPPQDVTEGMAEIAVVEGLVGNIEIKGNRWFSERALKRMLRVAANHVLFYDNLRSSLSFLNKSRDIKARAVLKPGMEGKTTDVEINVEDKFPLHLSTDVNNLGTENTGKHRWGVQMTHTNLLGLMDQAVARFQLGAGSWAVGASYDAPVHSSGTNAGYSFTHSRVDVGGPFKALDVEGRATTHSIRILQPLVRKPSIEITPQVGFDFKSIENKILGVKAGHDELRILNTGLNLEMTDHWGKTYIPQSFHFGFSNFLGASPQDSNTGTRAGAEAQFFVYRAFLIRYQRLPKDMTFAFRSTLQLSPDSLPPSEQLRLGGAFTVRGYPEGDYMGDYGGQFSTELYIPSFFFPADWKLPYSELPLRKQIQGVGFFDFGAGALTRPLAGEKEDRVLSGIGGGLRIQLFEKVYGRFQWAGRTGSRSSSGDNSAFYYGVSAEPF
ncbi:MAG: ShlB/FhaC/HecB family hemolysin secretion/activation protein [Candidatus Omnitrophica bacterium]|nr:ShlB/FhaC/HecB family hemolysin secretion/activation protein [Candidatus Omnitrophota bacterium]